MKSVLTTQNSILSGIGLVSDGQEAKEKAYLIADFAESIGEEFLKSMGLVEPDHSLPHCDSDEAYNSNLLAMRLDPEYEFDDELLALDLGLPHRELRAHPEGKYIGRLMVGQFRLHFCPDRVEVRTWEWDGQWLSPPDVPRNWRQAMTYEAAARFVVCHLAREILKVIQYRSNGDLDAALGIYARLKNLLTPQ